MWRAVSLEKTLMLGKIESRRRTVWDRWVALSTHGHEFEQTPEYGEGQGSLVCCSSWGSQRVSYGLVTEKQPGVTIVMYLNTINTSLWMNSWSTSNVVFSPLFLISQISSDTKNLLKRWYAETVASQILAKDFVHQWNYRSLCEY